MLFAWTSFESFVLYPKTTNVAAHVHIYKGFYCKNTSTLLLIKLLVRSFRCKKNRMDDFGRIFLGSGAMYILLCTDVLYSLCFLKIQWVQLAYDSIEHISRGGSTTIFLNMLVVLLKKKNKNWTSIDFKHI